MKSELEKLKADIERDRQAYIAAIDNLIGKIERQQKTNLPTAPVESDRPKIDVDEIIEGLIKTHQGTFTTDDIYLQLADRLRPKNPTILQARKISKIINRLRQRNPSEIKEVEKGVGSRSGKYSYLKP